MVITKKNGQLEYLTAQEIKTPHCFTTRLGGVSSGHLASLNIGFSRGTPNFSKVSHRGGPDDA